MLRFCCGLFCKITMRRYANPDLIPYFREKKENKFELKEQETMPNSAQEEKQLFASIFSDETPLFRTPAEPEVGDTVSIRLRIMKNAGAQVTFLTGMPTRVSNMQRIKTD
ncbi:MAG: hypothetical protein IKP72_04070, partial [Clostridia bacterium]|nr:hypothetical protein [Clostridia bacterium]